MNTPAEALWTWLTVCIYLAGIAAITILLLAVGYAAWQGRKNLLQDAQELVKSAERASAEQESKIARMR